MKITLSREQWEAMGKQAGWMKKAEEDLPVKSLSYRGFEITIHQPKQSLARDKNLFYYKIEGILPEGNSDGMDVAIGKAKKKIDNAIARSVGGGHDEILKEIEPFKIGYAPGQTPYTPEELALHKKLISDALKGDPGEEGEGSAFKEDDNVSRRRVVKVTFSDGDYLQTWINGTKKEIMKYYMPYGNRGPEQDYDDAHPEKTRHVVKVEFLS